MEYIALDVHKRYTLASVARPEGGLVREARIPHERGAVRAFLDRCERGSPVAVEATGNWYWVVDEIEAAGFLPKLVHARKAKLMMGMVNKTDKLDARGLNRLQQAGTLPTVWIPPGELRDQRDLPRTRMVLVRQRTQLKNRIHATLARYALPGPEVSDLFGRRGREWLRQHLGELPAHTAFSTGRLLEQIEALDREVDLFEQRIRDVFKPTPEVARLMTLPGVGLILGVLIALEVGDITRFPGPDNFIAYAGTTPRVRASGGKTRYGPLRSDVNHYLKWAFVEAANVICRLRERHPYRHVSRLYERAARRKGHHKAIGAVARHLAEAAYWMLTKRETYHEPRTRPRPAQAGLVHGGVSARCV
jgi:transposase